jgi:citrate synthase
MAVATLSVDDPEIDDISLPASRKRSARLLARVPAVVAAYWRIRQGKEPLESPANLGFSAGFLYMLTGSRPDEDVARALDAYLVSVSEHGMNASTFAGRVVISTDSDMVSSLTAAVCALKGPKHGGVPGPVLKMLQDIGEPARVEEWVRQNLIAGKKIMGFGHRIYKVRDPRAEVLSDAAQSLMKVNKGDAWLFDLTHAVEDTTVRVLAEVKPGRELYANVELYAALILHTIGIPSDVFTPVFAIGRTAGWTAHMIEQLRDNRLIRPTSVYIGPRDLKFVPMDERE